MDAACLAEEFKGCVFGDARLTKRGVQIAEILSQKPHVSIPAAFCTRAEFEACYRFFDNENVTPATILRPHFEATTERIRRCGFAVLAQDTTEIDLTRPKQQVEGAGPMDCESRRGAFYHPLIAFDEQGVSLGIVWQTTWTRDELSTASSLEKSKKRRKTPFEQKESHRWMEGLRAAQQTAEACPGTNCVCVGDSESDIYELFAAAKSSPTPNFNLLIRAGQKRNTTDQQDWRDAVRATPKIGDQSVRVRAREAKVGPGKSARSRTRKGRVAELEIRKATVEVARRQNGAHALPKSVTVNTVLCEEVNPPVHADPICWMLVTTLPIDTDEQVRRVIQAYCIRWQIEVYFRTLKSGCRIEHRRFEDIDRIVNCLAFYSVVAWRLMYICHIGRECPDLDCEVIFEPSEWKSVYATLRIKFPEKGSPRLNDVVRAIARLGGFINRPQNHPGTQTLWVGLQRCYDLSTAWNAFGPGAKKFSPE